MGGAARFPDPFSQCASTVRTRSEPNLNSHNITSLADLRNSTSIIIRHRIYESEYQANPADAGTTRSWRESYRTAAWRARRYITVFADARCFEEPQV